MIQMKRAYDSASPEDGFRVLVERFWPRDLTEKHAKVDLWLQQVAPSAALHTDFGDSPAPERWPEFERRYRAELQNKHRDIKLLRRKLREGPLTLVYAAHDADHNGAAVLKRFLEETTSVAERV